MNIMMPGTLITFGLSDWMIWSAFIALMERLQLHEHETAVGADP